MCAASGSESAVIRRHAWHGLVAVHDDLWHGRGYTSLRLRTLGLAAQHLLSVQHAHEPFLRRCAALDSAAAHRADALRAERRFTLSPTSTLEVQTCSARPRPCRPDLRLPIVADGGERPARRSAWTDHFLGSRAHGSHGLPRSWTSLRSTYGSIVQEHRSFSMLSPVVTTGSLAPDRGPHFCPFTTGTGVANNRRRQVGTTWCRRARRASVGRPTLSGPPRRDPWRDGGVRESRDRPQASRRASQRPRTAADVGDRETCRQWATHRDSRPPGGAEATRSRATCACSATARESSTHGGRLRRR